MSTCTGKQGESGPWLSHVSVHHKGQEESEHEEWLLRIACFRSQGRKAFKIENLGAFISSDARKTVVKQNPGVLSSGREEDHKQQDGW